MTGHLRHRGASAAIDFALSRHGSIAVLIPRSAAANAWRDEFLPDDALGWAGGTVIEHRYLPDILAGLLAAGLRLEPT